VPQAHEMSYPEFPNVVSLLAGQFEGTGFSHFLNTWENIIFATFVAIILVVVGYRSSRCIVMIPGRLQNAVEFLVETLNDFICQIIGPRGRQYTPFIGTLFIYIFAMNLLGFVPLLKSATTDWSVTAALAICVFVYVQYTALKEHGFLGYMDHLAGKPRGGFAYSIIFPIFMFLLHVTTEIVKPLTLSLRLRSNIWGEDMLLAVLAGFGLKGIAMLLFNTCLALVAATVQAMVFAILTTIYFSLVLAQEE